MADFTGKTALVGGTTGIGRATALAFAEAGANVVVAGRGAEHGRDAEAQIRASGREAMFVETDVSREADVQALMEAAAGRFGRIDAAVNNAGIEGRTGPIQDATEADFDALVGVNLKGVWLGLKHQIPHMLAHGGGAIVNLSSIGGVVGFPGTGIYCATKHGVIGLTKTAALEQAASGIRINAVAPGAVQTGLLERMAGGEEKARQVAAEIPMRRIAQPPEIAAAILWLCSDAASYVTGHTLLADGGLTAR